MWQKRRKEISLKFVLGSLAEGEPKLFAKTKRGLFPQQRLLPFFLSLPFRGGFRGSQLIERVVHHALHLEQRSGLSGPNLKLACALLDKHF